MASPFPGMDPYLESRWGDVHDSFVIYARDQLRPQLPPDLRARVNQRLLVQALPAEPRAIKPDIQVVERGRAAESHSGAAPSVTLLAAADPTLVLLLDEPETESYLEIVSALDGAVVTVVELLSPANKRPGPWQDSFLRKQEELRASAVSLVQIDLLRGGRRGTLAPPERLPARHRQTYQVCVWRAWKALSVAVYALDLRERLPVIPVPLRAGDPEPGLDLQELLARCYEAGGYDDLDYRSAPEPPFEPEEAAWADQLLRAAGRRP